MLRPHDALKMQVDLRDNLARPAYARIVDNYLCSAMFKVDHPEFWKINVMEHPGIEAYKHLRLGEDFIEDERRTLSEATTYVVAEQMNALVRRASEDLNDDMALEDHILPATKGFLVFEEPFAYQTFGGESMVCKALSWSVVTFQAGQGFESGPGAVVNFYHDLTHDQRNSGETDEEVRQAQKLIGNLAMQHRIEVRFGRKFGHMRANHYTPEEQAAALAPVRAIMTIWLLMQQTVTETVKHAFTEKNARRWEKKGVPPEVRTVNLRRRALTEAGQRATAHGSREYSHQWYVKAHWKRVVYGPGRKERRWTYIHPYIAGPPDKPLLQQKKVYRLSR